jgi:hypothetical protein
VRLYPAVTQDEAQAWLTAQAVTTIGEDSVSALSGDIATLAEAMSIISSVQLPDDLEPLFP